MPTEKKDLHYFITRVVNPYLNWIVVSLRSSEHVVYGRDGYTGFRWSDHSISDKLASRLEEWRDNLWYNYRQDFPENGREILDKFFEILVMAEAKLSEDPKNESAIKELWELAEEMGKYLELSDYVSQKAEEVKKRAAEIRERDRYLKERVKEVSVSKEPKTRSTLSRSVSSPSVRTKVSKNARRRRVSRKHVKKIPYRKKNILKNLVGWIVALLILAVGTSWIITGSPTRVIEDMISGKLIESDHRSGYNYTAYPVPRAFPYCLRAQKGEISLTLYGGVVEYMEDVPRTVYSGQEDEYWDIMVDRLIENEVQDEYLTLLVRKIQSLTDNSDDQLRIAVSLVQMIPYDLSTYSLRTTYMKSPYEVLYYDKGVCSEKSFLLAYLLKKLGYGVILLEYKEEDHMAVAVKCPPQYANFWYGNTGYCFIETTRPTIITYIPDTYAGVGELKSTPHMIFVSDGREFTGVKEEYGDAKEYERLVELARRNNNILPAPEYHRWRYLVSKYCLLDKGS